MGLSVTLLAHLSWVSLISLGLSLCLLGSQVLPGFQCPLGLAASLSGVTQKNNSQGIRHI